MIQSSYGGILNSTDPIFDPPPSVKTDAKDLRYVRVNPHVRIHHLRCCRGIDM